MSKHLIMGTAGHVDHGKTALIHALTGIDCDTHKEEKDRGITINLGFAHLDLTDDLSLGIVDVPGHKDFIRNMVAGAHGIDFVLLVIAADSGIMPQTREHLNIIRMLGIDKGLVALTKADLVDGEMLELATLEVMDFIEDTGLKDADIIPVSSVTGQGIDKLRSAIHQFAGGLPEKTPGNTFRMYIDRIFNVKGHGIVVTGSVLGGRVKTGDELFLLPGSHDKLRVKSIQRHGKPVEETTAGDRAALNLAGLKFETFDRGMLLADKQLDETTMVDARVNLFKAQHIRDIWSQVIFHTGTFHSMARMHLINADKIDAVGSAIAQIHLEKPAILMKKDRFIIRNSSNDTTLGGGMIIDEKPLHHRRRTKKLVDQLEKLSEAMVSQGNFIQLLLIELDKTGKPLPLESLAEKTGHSLEEIRENLKTEGEGIDVVDYEGREFAIADSYKNQIRKKALDEISTWHTENPLKASGLEPKALAGKLKLSTAFENHFLEILLNEMIDSDELKQSGSTYTLSGHKVKISKKMQDQLDWVENTLRRLSLQKPTLQDLEEKARSEGIKKSTLKMLLNYLSDEGRIYFNGEDVLHQDVIADCRNKLLNELSGKTKGINEKEFRLLINGSKKLVQVLVDIFLKEGLIEKKTFFLHITEKGKQLAGK